MSDLRPMLEKINELKKERHQIVQQTPFEECLKLREIGDIYRDAEDVDRAVERLKSRYDMDEDEAENRLRQYLALFKTDPQNSFRVEKFGSQFFDGDEVEELSDGVRFSQGEIKRWIREYTGTHIQKVDQVTRELVDSPPNQDSLYGPQRELQSEAVDTLTDINIAGFLESVEEIEESEFDFQWIDFLVAGFQSELYEIYKQGGEEEVLSALSQFLKKEETCEAVLEQVNSKYLRGEREELMKQAIDAHNEGRYGLSIPVALTQIDGAIIESATELGIWELDNTVTGTKVVSKGEGSPQHIAEFREPFKQIYPRLMGRGTPRSNILHGIRTDFVDDEAFSAKMIWMALKSFSVAGKIHSELYIREESLLDYLSVSLPKGVEEIATRFRSNEFHASDHCDQLAEKEYLEKTDNDTYTLASAGEDRLSDHRGY